MVFFMDYKTQLDCDIIWMRSIIHTMREVKWLGVKQGFSTGASGLGSFKLDFINLPEGNLSTITPST